jgi:hypothetical protein
MGDGALVGADALALGLDAGVAGSGADGSVTAEGVSPLGSSFPSVARGSDGSAVVELSGSTGRINAATTSAMQQPRTKAMA